MDISDHGQGRILVMDDEEMIQELLTDILETMGFSTTTTSEGKGAVAEFIKASRLNKPFSAVILDLKIPGKMGGLETVKQIRKLDHNIPVFVATGFSDDEVIKDSEAFGFTAGLKKPFAIAQIALVFEKYLL